MSSTNVATVSTSSSSQQQQTSSKKNDLAQLVANNSKEETKLQKLHKVAGASDVSKCPYHKTMNFVKGAFGIKTNETVKVEKKAEKEEEEKDESGWCIVM